jgi:hypothetical protein
MNSLLRVGACAAVLLGAVLFVGCVLVPWLGGPSLFPADLPEVCQRLIEESNRQGELDEHGRYSREQLEGKRTVTLDVIAGRASLTEAVARFRRLRDQEEEKLEAAGLGYRTGNVSDEELARNVVAWVRAAVRDDPRRDVVLRRLEEEFHLAFPNARPVV